MVHWYKDFENFITLNSNLRPNPTELNIQFCQWALRMVNYDPDFLDMRFFL